MAWVSVLVALSTLQVGVATAPRPAVLSCTVPDTAMATPAAMDRPPMKERVFRIGPGLLEEWLDLYEGFGPNLCEVAVCVSDPGKTEGTISTASVAYTIGIDASSRAGYWRVIGATGFRQTEGVCRLIADPSAPRP